MMAQRSPVATIPLSEPPSSMVLSHMSIWSISLTLFHTGSTRTLTIHPIFPGLMELEKESRNILPISLRTEKASSCLFHYTGYDSPFWYAYLVTLTYNRYLCRILHFCRLLQSTKEMNTLLKFFFSFYKFNKIYMVNTISLL